MIFRELEQLVNEVWDLDGEVARHGAGYRGDPQGARSKICSVFDQADEVLMRLPSLIVTVLYQRGHVEGEPRRTPVGFDAD